MYRLLGSGEIRYLRHLLLEAGEARWAEWLDDLMVEPMDDGGMGSLRFYSSKSGRRREAQLVADEFLDTDSVPVSVEVTTDQYGDLFELDSFKADFSALRSWPPRY